MNNRILLVDDDIDITTSFKIGLGGYDFTVSIYNDTKLALSEFKENLYDLLLTDIRMPGMSGVELYMYFYVNTLFIIKANATKIHRIWIINYNKMLVLCYIDLYYLNSIYVYTSRIWSIK